MGSSFAQFLRNAGINMAPGLFVGIIAGGLLFVIALVVAIVFVRRRNKRKMRQGAFDKPTLSVLTLAQPRPSLPIPDDTEAQHKLVGREMLQQEATYRQLMIDLHRPSSRANTPSLPDQAPRDISALRRPPIMQEPSPMHITVPPPTAPVTPPSTDLLKRGLSVRSADSASLYSTTSAPYSTHANEATYQPFATELPAIPASPSTTMSPKWPSSPAPYIWPKRQRASLIRDELAPETYSKVRWKTDASESASPAPVVQALPSTPTTPSRGRELRIQVPPTTVGQREIETGYFTPRSGAFPRPTPQDISQRPY
ncbi:hypothetical protein MKEN_00695800 [Mycena kentingensis (nom. inval.)]|nr:hypothetical protein MKEN_00695800 [Mycena kentingensis (nom. inval.)]